MTAGLEVQLGGSVVSEREKETPATPMPPGERIATLDALRGLALLGVLVINLETTFRVSIFQQFIPALREGGLDG